MYQEMKNISGWGHECKDLTSVFNLIYFGAKHITLVVGDPRWFSFIFVNTEYNVHS